MADYGYWIARRTADLVTTYKRLYHLQFMDSLRLRRRNLREKRRICTDFESALPNGPKE